MMAPRDSMNESYYFGLTLEMDDLFESFFYQKENLTEDEKRFLNHTEKHPNGIGIYQGKCNLKYAHALYQCSDVALAEVFGKCYD